MRNLFVLIIVISTTVLNLKAQSDKGRLYPMQHNFKWGYINNSGEWIIKPEYNWAVPFKDNRAFVTKTSGVYVIDKSGEVLFNYSNLNYVSLTNYGIRIKIGPEAFSEGFVKEGDGKYIDVNGETVLNKTCDRCGDFGHFSDGLAFFRKNGKYGFIDKEGKEVIAAQYSKAKAFSNGLAVVAKRSDNGLRWGVINTEGESVIPFVYRELESFHHGLAKFKTASKRRRSGYYPFVGFINQQHDTVVKPKYKPFGLEDRFHNGYFAVKFDNGKMGYLDSLGKISIPGKFKNVAPFSEGLAFVTLQTKEGKKSNFFINKKGEKVIDSPILDTAMAVGRFQNGLVRIALNLYGKSGYSASGSGSYKRYRNAYYAYMNRKGEIVKIQSPGETKYMRAVIDSIKNEKALAEQRKKEAKENRLKEKLKDCPDFLEYGNDKSKNSITLNLEGKKRLLYFDEPTLEIRKTKSGKEMYVYFPLFGLSLQDRERLKEDAGGGIFSSIVKSYYDNLSKFKIKIKEKTREKFEFIDHKITFLDCMKDIPGKYYDEIWDKYSDREITVKQQGDAYKINLSSKAQKNPENYISFNIETDKVINRDLSSLNLKKGENELFEYYPKQNILNYPASGLTKKYKTIQLPKDQEKLFTTRSDQYLKIFNIDKFSENEISITKNTINLEEVDDKWKNSIFEAPYANDINPHQYDLSKSTATKEIKTKNVIYLQTDFLIMDPDKIPGLLPKLKPSPEPLSYDEIDNMDGFDFQYIKDRTVMYDKSGTNVFHTNIEKASHKKSKSKQAKALKVERQNPHSEFMVSINNQNCEQCIALDLIGGRDVMRAEKIKLQLSKSLTAKKYEAVMALCSFLAGIDKNNIVEQEEKIMNKIKALDLEIEESNELKQYVRNFGKKLAEITEQRTAFRTLLTVEQVKESKKFLPFYYALIKAQEQLNDQRISIVEKDAIINDLDKEAAKLGITIREEIGGKENGSLIQYSNYCQLLKNKFEAKYGREITKFLRPYIKSKQKEIKLKTDKNFNPKTRTHSRAYQYNTPPAKIKIEYLEDKIKLTAISQAQGIDEVQIDKPDNIYDIYQLQTILSSLEYSKGFETKISFFDLSLTQTFSYSTDEGSMAALKLKPIYLRADVSVLKDTSYTQDGVAKKGYEIKVHFRGDFSNHPLVGSYPRLKYDNASGEGYAIFILSEDSPSKK